MNLLASAVFLLTFALGATPPEKPLGLSQKTKEDLESAAKPKKAGSAPLLRASGRHPALVDRPIYKSLLLDSLSGEDGSDGPSGAIVRKVLAEPKILVEDTSILPTRRKVSKEPKAKERMKDSKEKETVPGPEKEVLQVREADPLEYQRVDLQSAQFKAVAMKLNLAARFGNPQDFSKYTDGMPIDMLKTHLDCRHMAHRCPLALAVLHKEEGMAVIIMAKMLEIFAPANGDASPEFISRMLSNEYGSAPFTAIDNDNMDAARLWMKLLGGKDACNLQFKAEWGMTGLCTYAQTMSKLEIVAMLKKEFGCKVEYPPQPEVNISPAVSYESPRVFKRPRKVSSLGMPGGKGDSPRSSSSRSGSPRTNDKTGSPRSEHSSPRLDKSGSPRRDKNSNGSRKSSPRPDQLKSSSPRLDRSPSPRSTGNSKEFISIASTSGGASLDGSTDSPRRKHSSLISRVFTRSGGAKKSSNSASASGADSMSSGGSASVSTDSGKSDSHD